jgi:2-polyprenyl-6-methoxyphenol hydroxylase-like FAD-dependent oxidoreductase
MVDGQKIHVTCCIAGGGPAGMMLGFLLARSGVAVLVLEKHADFLRDFRGDTIHPSTLEVMHELGILDEFLKRPHQEVRQIKAQVGDSYLTVGDFSHLPTRCKFIALMPQWDFLNFIAEQAKQYPGFQLKMETEVIGLIEENGRIAGLRAKTSSGELEIFAELSVGADGRHSVVREKASLDIIQLGAPMDVLWMRLSKKTSDPEQTLGRIDAGHILVLLDRGDYWQVAFVIPKGTLDEIRQKGLSYLQKQIGELVPFLRDRVGELRDWDDIKLLTVAVDRLRRWYRAGLLCIGDAAHAMSPVGGVGINLAIQDAVAAANILAPAFQQGHVHLKHLQQIQQRRELPTRIVQGVQIFVQNRIIRRVLASQTGKARPPLVLRLAQRCPILQTVPAWLIGMGFRPEHVTTCPPGAHRASTENNGLVSG